MIEHALAAAARGWQVFPLKPNEKTPLINHWDEHVTTDEQQIQEWWAKWPDANYGVATGPSELVVIDIDVPKSSGYIEGPYGIDAWCWLVFNAGLKKEPRTLEIDTPSGGQHIYWLANKAIEVRNSAGKLAPGVDVRADGGYVVGPGSRTEQGTYEYNGQRKVEKIPSWLRSALTASGSATTQVQQHARKTTAKPVTNGDDYALAALKGEVDNVKQTPIGVGQRNNALNTAAFKLRKFIEKGALNGNDVADQLFNAAMSINMNEKEAIKTIKSGLGV